jgi:hypothetical protein
MWDDIKRKRGITMTNDDARLAIFNHFVAFFMDTEDPGDWTVEQVDQWRTTGENYSECLIGSMGMEVLSVEDDVITVTLKLQDTLKYINEWLSGDVVSVDKSL